jgi:hypothetical protein
MAVTATPIFPQAPKVYTAQILPADTTSKKTLCAGGTNGTRIDALNIASTDTSNRDIQLWMNNGSIDLLLTTLQIPLNAGNANNVAAVDGMRQANFPGLSYDANGNPTILVPNGYTLKIACTGTVTAAKEIDAVATASDF